MPTTTVETEPKKTKAKKGVIALPERATCHHAETEELVKIFSGFDPEVLDEAWHVVTEGAPCHLKTATDVPDPGKEMKVGEEGRVRIEDLALLERIIPTENNLLPVHFLEEGALVQKAVARIAFAQSYNGYPTGSGYGTGFLVSPSLLMTNNHVIDDKAIARKLKAEFNYQYDHLGNALPIDAYTFDPDDVFYTNPTLDFTLIRVNVKCLFRPFGPFLREGEQMSLEDGYGDGEWANEFQFEYTPLPGSPPPAPFPPRLPLPVPPLMPPKIKWPLYKLCRKAGQRWGYLQLPASGIAYASTQHVNVIQHPRGRRKEVAVHHNHIEDIYLNALRYTTDTEPGSSGSPVFNNAWDLVVIHHAGGEFNSSTTQWVNNEGMRLDKIVIDLRNQFQGTTTGNAILAELGI